MLSSCINNNKSTTLILLFSRDYYVDIVGQGMLCKKTRSILYSVIITRIKRTKNSTVPYGTVPYNRNVCHHGQTNGPAPTYVLIQLYYSVPYNCTTPSIIFGALPYRWTDNKIKNESGKILR